MGLSGEGPSGGQGSGRAGLWAGLMIWSWHGKTADTFREQLDKGESHDQEVKTVPTILRGGENIGRVFCSFDIGKFKQIWKNGNLEKL